MEHCGLIHYATTAPQNFTHYSLIWLHPSQSMQHRLNAEHYHSRFHNYARKSIRVYLYEILKHYRKNNRVNVAYPTKTSLEYRLSGSRGEVVFLRTVVDLMGCPNHINFLSGRVEKNEKGHGERKLKYILKNNSIMFHKLSVMVFYVKQRRRSWGGGGGQWKYWGGGQTYRFAPPPNNFDNLKNS